MIFSLCSPQQMTEFLADPVLFDILKEGDRQTLQDKVSVDQLAKEAFPVPKVNQSHILQLF